MDAVSKIIRRLATIWLVVVCLFGLTMTLIPIAVEHQVKSAAAMTDTDFFHRDDDTATNAVDAYAVPDRQGDTEYHDGLNFTPGQPMVDTSRYNH